MRFSIIIPAYNSEKYIVKALHSVKMQTFTDYELIVVCDSCEDNTMELAQAFGAITVAVGYHNDGLTRSAGLDIAQGEYVLFMDDDDWWTDDKMLEYLNTKIMLEKTPDVIAFGFYFRGIGHAHARRTGGDLWIATWNKCWKRSSIGETRFPNVKSISDRYFHNEMMAKDLRIVECDKEFYYYNYLREGSQSQLQGNTLHGTLQFIEKYGI